MHTHHPKDYSSSSADEKHLHQRVVKRNEAEEQILSQFCGQGKKGGVRVAI